MANKSQSGVCAGKRNPHRRIKMIIYSSSGITFLTLRFPQLISMMILTGIWKVL